LHAQTNDWLRTEGERWIFVAKAMLASFSALWLAFRLGLDAPYTALATTIILAMPSSGMVLEKAFYRFLGTLVGCAAALALVGFFPQAPVVLFIGLALWVALCTGGAAMHRNQQSYSFVLAGYTAVMIAVPAVDAPAHVFTLAVTRVTEVGLGIICSAVVHDVFFPRRHSRTVMRTVQARYAGFIDFCRQVLEHRITPDDAELNHLRFAADIAALESGRAAAFFEAGHSRSHTLQLHAFNAAFMTALTTFYTLHRLSHRLGHRPPGADAGVDDGASKRAEAGFDAGAGERAGTRADEGPVLALLAPMYAHMARALRDDLTPARLAQMRHGLAKDIAAARAQLAAGPALARPQQIDFDTAAELLERFAANLADFAALYHGLAQEKRQQVSDPGAYSPKTPPAIIFASGFRAGAALLITAAMSYWLAWPAAVNSLLMATIFCALASSSPRPTVLVQQVTTGFLIATPLAFVTEFLMVAKADNFAPLVLAALPLFAFGAYLSSGPRWAGVGIGVGMFSATLVVPTNLMRYDVEAFIGSELSMILGVVVAYLMFKVVLPEHTMGHRGHVAAALWREAQQACDARLHRLKHRFDNRVRDLLSQLNAAAGPAPNAETRAVVRQGLTLLELGHAVIELRQLLHAAHAGAARDSLQAVLDRLAAYLHASPRERHQHGERALQAILDAGTAVRAALADTPSESERRARLQTALTDLHSIYTSLLDQFSGD
jgi:uncharacterized membrane protein YccC